MTQKEEEEQKEAVFLVHAPLLSCLRKGTFIIQGSLTSCCLPVLSSLLQSRTVQFLKNTDCEATFGWDRERREQEKILKEICHILFAFLCDLKRLKCNRDGSSIFLKNCNGR